MPSGDRRHNDAVTHAGLPPRLGKAAKQSPETGDAEFDEEQTWHQAANALRMNEHAKAALLAEQLIARAPHKGVYRVLAARALVELERWEDADRHASWLLEGARGSSELASTPRVVEGWQQDWAHVVRARVYVRTGRAREAQAILKRLLQGEHSPHAEAAARKLLAEIKGGEGRE